MERKPDPPIMLVDGVDYSPEGIDKLRQWVIKGRDVALNHGLSEHAVGLTHVIVLLAYLKEIRERAVPPLADTSDLDAMMALLNRLGVAFDVTEVRALTGETILTLRSGTRHVSGYDHAYAEWSFDYAGKFINVGLWT